MNPLTILLTGATIGGIGFETALDLAASGHRLLITCRTLDRSEAAAEAISRKGSCIRPIAFALDISEEKSIQSFAERIIKSHSRIDVLINNAGFLRIRKFVNSLEMEMSMAVNYFGTKSLTEKLLPIIPEGGRIINVTSSTSSRGKLNFNDLYMKNNFNGFQAYFNSKFILNMYTRDLAYRLKEKGITVNALHPGNIITNIWNLWPHNEILKFLVSLIERTGFLSAAKGARTSIYLAVSSDVTNKTDGYYIRNKLVDWPKNCRDISRNTLILKEFHQYHTV